MTKTDKPWTMPRSTQRGYWYPERGTIPGVERREGKRARTAKKTKKKPA